MNDQVQLVLEKTAAALEAKDLYKVASEVLGFDVTDEKAILTQIGTKLAMQRLEQRKIQKGLAALNDIKE